MTHPVKSPRKLIEVALPLDAINIAAAREKSIRHGHPSTLHLWWARRPLAAARAVIFSQLVNDPSWKWEMESPGKIPPGHLKASWAASRKRLFKIIEDLVLWENTTNEEVLEKARSEIRRSWREVCALNQDHPQAAELFNPDQLPALHDPFAGGGSIPLEAQRLGLEAYASDLNPVAVLINKAMIEIPPKFAGMPPVNPEARKPENALGKTWKGAAGLAEDVRYYGAWMREEAQKRIGHLYPPVEITADMAQDRPDLKPLIGQKLTVIAWLWARTVKSPNPAFSHVDVPLASTFILSSKSGKEAYVQPVIEGDHYRFTSRTGTLPTTAKNGTKLARGANFRCIMSDIAIEGNYIKAEGRAGRMGAKMMAIVAEGDRGRIYLSPTREMEAVAAKAEPTWKPDLPLPSDLRVFWTPLYGITHYYHLFTSRQLVALTTFSDLVVEAREKIHQDALAAGMRDDSKSLDANGTGITAYAEAVSVYLAFAMDKSSDYWSSICTWHSSKELIRNTFGRQAIPMAWDFAETNPLSDSTGNMNSGFEWAEKAIRYFPSLVQGVASQADAQTQSVSFHKVISTDPPYCLTPGTLIQTRHGYQTIETLKVGDEVLTHKGRYAPITRTYERFYQGGMHRFTVAHTNQPLQITPEHPIQGIRTTGCGYQVMDYCRADCSYLAQQGCCRHQAFADYQLEWIKSSEVKEHDLIFMPQLKADSQAVPEKLRLLDWLPNEAYLEQAGELHYQKATLHSLSRRATTRQYQLLAEVQINADLCRLLGYFVAEGYANVRSDGGTVNFVFHQEEAFLHQDVRRSMEQCFGIFAGKDTSQENSKALRLNFYSKPLAQLFRAWCYTEDGYKRLPDWILELPEPLLKECLKGYWLGDGCRRSRVYEVSTNSAALAGQIRLLLHRLGIIARLHINEKAKQYKSVVNGATIQGTGAKYQLIVTGNQLPQLAGIVGLPKQGTLSASFHKPHGHVWDGGYLLPIRAVETVDYNGYVYNLETEDHSYVTTAGCVHNCDNIGYADLSDFFYVWLRRTLRSIYPNLLATIAVPKAQELVSTPYRHGSKQAAENFFLDGMSEAMHQLAEQAHLAFPVTIYYAYKQSDTDADGKTASMGWVTFLKAVIQAGFTLTGTWPMRTELANRMISSGTNALASSIVLVCRKRPVNALTVSRREFLRELNAVLPEALDEMTKGSGDDRSPVAPVDLSQAIIGPGMAVFSKYAAVLEADGSPMSVRTALQLINRFLAEDDFDPDTQFCLHWFDQYGWAEAAYGEADVLARAKSTSVNGLAESGVLHSGGGKVRLLRPDEYPAVWDPEKDTRLPIWEALHQLIRTLRQQGESGAGQLLAAVKAKGEGVRQLAYRLYTLCERQGWAEDARAYNELITSWSGIESAASEVEKPLRQGSLFNA